MRDIVIDMDAASDHGTKPRLVPMLDEDGDSLTDRIGSLHRQLVLTVPEVDQMACVIYDPETDALRTFVDSTIAGKPLRGYEYPLASSPSLSELVQTRSRRVLDDIPVQAPGPSAHASHIRAAGFRSSYTVPLFDQEVFQGFLFMDSLRPGAFTKDVIERLEVYVNLARLMLSQELTAARALVGSIRVAKDFAALRDIETGAHLDRIARYARLIARHLAHTHTLPDEYVEQVFLFAGLHDIGKVGIPDSILHKPAVLTFEEREIMKTHVDLGVQIVDTLIENFRLGHLAGIDVLRNIVASHHEFLDGSGYPHGLRGHDIPLEARIATVADIFDALTSRRDYKQPWPLEDAFVMLTTMAAAGQLDPECVSALQHDREQDPAKAVG